MDEQQSTQAQQTLQTNQSASNVPTGAPVINDQFPPDAPLPPTPTIAKISPKKSKKKLLLTLLVVLLLAAGAMAYWFLLKEDDKSNNTTQNQATTQEHQQLTTTPGPYAVIYSDGKKPQLLLRPLDVTKSESSLAGTDNAGGYVVVSANNIAYVAYANDTVKSETIHLSTDAGKTFKTIYTGKTNTEADPLAEQITSIHFSDDNKQLAIASLVYADGDLPNTIKIYDIASSTIKKAFSTKYTGVIIEKFNTKTNTVYYTTAKANSDAGPDPFLYSNNINSPKEVIVYEDKTPNVYSSFALNSEVTKLLISKANSNCDGLGGCKPYSVEEYDITTKTAKTLVTITTDTAPVFGYSTTNEPYVSNENKILTLKNGASAPSLLFEGNLPVSSIDYVDDSTVVFTAGNENSYTLFTFDRSGNKTTDIQKLLSPYIGGVLVN